MSDAVQLASSSAVSPAPQSLPDLYVESVRRGTASQNCFACRASFAICELRLGYTLDGLFAPHWIHVRCASRARLALRPGCSQVSFSPAVPESERNEILHMLRRLSTLCTTMRVKKWNYLPASVHHWGSEVIPEAIVAARPSPEHRFPGEELSEDREGELSAILNALPSEQLSTDLERGNPCAICHMPMRQGDMVCRLPCHHLYHVGCIDTWLRVRTTCPLDNLRIESMLQSAVD